MLRSFSSVVEIPAPLRSTHLMVTGWAESESSVTTWFLSMVRRFAPSVLT